jgi:hypothetical protein
MYIYICIYIYVYIHVHIYRHIHTQIYMNTCMYNYMQPNSEKSVVLALIDKPKVFYMYLYVYID